MDHALFNAIRSALDARDEGDPDWAFRIASALSDHQESAAIPDDLEPIVKDVFKDCRDEPFFGAAVGEVLSRSPVLADRAVAALFWHIGREPDPALVVDWRMPGSTWFVIYDDDSVMDPDNVQWSHWMDFIEYLYYPENDPAYSVFLDAQNEYGRTIMPGVSAALAKRGYRPEPAPATW